MTFSYRLVVTTDGRPGLLERTLESFAARVQPKPVELAIVDDSGDLDYHRYLNALVADVGPDLLADPRATFVGSHGAREGFCRTVADAWNLAAQSGPRHVFWLEDDFLFRRAVDLRDLATVLDGSAHVAQMALYRDPVNAEEIAAGGYIALRPDTYLRRGAGAKVWLEHRNHWTTNPSLFRRELAVGNPWPTCRECEGVFGFNLRAAWPEASFGVWGDGSVWVEHVGERAGTGY